MLLSPKMRAEIGREVNRLFEGDFDEARNWGRIKGVMVVGEWFSHLSDDRAQKFLDTLK